MRNMYSILIKNGFKAPDTSNVMMFRGYLHYFITNVLQGQDAVDIKEITVNYTDEQYRKLLNRLKENGHML